MKNNGKLGITMPIFFADGDIIFPKSTDRIEISELVDAAVFSAAEESVHRVFILPVETRDAFADVDSVESAMATAKSVYDKTESKIGIICEIVNVQPLRDRSLLVTLNGIVKATCIQTKKNKNVDGVLDGDLLPVFDDELTAEEEEEFKACRKIIRSDFNAFLTVKEDVESKKINSKSFLNERDPETYTYKLASALELEPYEQIEILHTTNVLQRIKYIALAILRQIEYLKIRESIMSDANSSLSDQQREIFLREQLKAIQTQLGDDEYSEYEGLKDQLNAKKKFMPESTFEKISKELERMRRVSSMSADYPVVRQHIEFLLDLPWEPAPQKPVELTRLREILDRDHYGLEKVKDRVVEFMAVKTMKGATANNTICLFGPPGTGKTSIVRSIAEALDREYVRISLGGVRDEAEIRGHRKTYVGAMQGRILDALEKVKTRNPVILLDEIDKMCGDFRGDPASALLEVLDKEQNKDFIDTYAEIPFDLSEVLFITTANSLDPIPSPLLDRLEVIELSSYTEIEKFEIAKRHLIPRQGKEHGLSKSAVKINDEAIYALINDYTAEAGVRGLDRQIAAIMRKCICVMKTQGKKSITVNKDRLFELLGAGRAIHRFDTGDDNFKVGSVNGMAWTSIGGVLLEVMVNVFEGTGKVEVTGLIGDVMKESATAAISWIRSKASDFGIPADFYKTKDIHIHIPEGATPKDGPSAGVTLTTAVISALTGKSVRQSIAMTGEITIHGEVLAIGGLKEKTLAALKEGISTVIVPAENAADVRELPDAVKNGMKIIMVKHVTEVLDIALV